MSTSMADLADILKQRDIKTLHYFHADHYEPWSLGLNERTAAGVDRFGEMTRSSPFGSHMSLFYSAFVPYNVDLTKGRSAPGRRVGNDAVVFHPRSAAQEELARQTIRPLFESGRHELHLHVHHEFWTRNDSHFDSEVSKWVNAHSNAEMDRDRLDLFFALCKEIIEREVGTNFDRWAFVHGNWALAASDPLICTIENELSMIMRHGGWGDFSFPAGRGYCDPKLELPFTCHPIDGKRPYDDPESDPRPLASGSHVLAPERFFIWNSPIKAQYSSLDYYSESNRELFKDSGRMLGQWLTNSVAFGSDLFLKTHAHSMKWEYEIFKPDSRIPHLYPDVVNIFEDLLRVCDRAGVEFRPVTVNQVMETLGALDQGRSVSAPAKAATAPRPAAAAPARAGKAASPSAAKAGATAAKRGRAPRQAVGLDKVEALDTYLLTNLRKWVEEDPGRSEGAGTFYLELLKGKQLLQDYERAVLEYLVAETKPEETTVLEVGIGYGILSLMLAAAGFEVVASEGSRARLDGFEFLLSSLGKRVPGIAERVRPLHGWFPDSFDPASLVKDRRNVLVATNIVATASAARQEAILEVARSFDDLIVDTTRFGVVRYDSAVAEELHRAIAAHCKPVTALWRRAPNEIWHYQPERVRAEAAPQPALVTAAAPQPSPSLIAEPAPQPSPPLVTGAATLDGFDRELLDLQRVWMDGEGLSLPHDDLYAAKIARGIALEAHEVALAAALAERFEPAATEIVEIGYGQGALSLFLGRQGYAVYGYEGDRRRSAAAVSHLKKQAERHPGLAVSFSTGFFPDAAALPVVDAGKRRICIATNITCTYTDTHREAILDAVAQLDEFIFDLGRFGRNRNSQQERDELRDELVGRGFEPVERLHFAAPYEYWRFRAPVLAKAAVPDARARTAAASAPAEQPSVVAAPTTEARPESAAEGAGKHGLFPIRDDVGAIFSIFGDKRLDGCPVCDGRATAQLWRMPMSNLSQPINAFGGYYHQAPSLQTPSTVYCFDFCRDCHSIYLNPVAANRKQNYRTTEHQIRMMQDEAAWRGYEEVFERFARWMPDGGTMIDAACGIGQYLEIARKRSPGKWHRLVGLELSERYVAHMRQRNIDAHLFDLDSDPLDPIVKQASADVAFFCEAFQYVERPREVIRKLLGALRPGGRLCFTALRYGRDVQAGVRPSEPVYVGQKWLEGLSESLGCRVLDVEVSPMRYYVTLEK